MSSDIAKSPQGVWVGNKILPGWEAVSFSCIISVTWHARQLWLHTHGFVEPLSPLDHTQPVTPGSVSSLPSDASKTHSLDTSFLSLLNYFSHLKLSASPPQKHHLSSRKSCHFQNECADEPDLTLLHTLGLCYGTNNHPGAIRGRTSSRLSLEHQFVARLVPFSCHYGYIIETAMNLSWAILHDLCLHSKAKGTTHFSLCLDKVVLYSSLCPEVTYWQSPKSTFLKGNNNDGYYYYYKWQE